MFRNMFIIIIPESGIRSTSWTLYWFQIWYMMATFLYLYMMPIRKIYVERYADSSETCTRGRCSSAWTRSCEVAVSSAWNAQHIFYIMELRHWHALAFGCKDARAFAIFLRKYCSRSISLQTLRLLNLPFFILERVLRHSNEKTCERIFDSRLLKMI